MLTLVLAPGSVAAQTPSDFAGNLGPPYQGILARPSDLNNTLQYAASASADDIESAIGTYEQLLFYNPKLSRLRFELGVLYFRLGSYEMAGSYLRSALQMPDITPDLQERCEDLLAIVDKKLMVDRFTGDIQTGLAYQSNPGSGPGGQTVLASRGKFNPQFFAQNDWNWFGAFAVNYVHDFETQNGDTFEASAVGYDAQEFRLHQFDVGVLEFRAGPRFGIATGDPKVSLSIKPYVIATGALLADAPYYGGVGGGLTVHTNIGNVALDPYAEIVQQSFRNSSFYPLASGFGGTLIDLRPASVGTDRVKLGLPIAAGLRPCQRQLQSLQLRRLCRRPMAAVEFLFSRRRPDVDAHSELRRQPLALCRARSRRLIRTPRRARPNGASASDWKSRCGGKWYSARWCNIAPINPMWRHSRCTTFRFPPDPRSNFRIAEKPP